MAITKAIILLDEGSKTAGTVVGRAIFRNEAIVQFKLPDNQFLWDASTYAVQDGDRWVDGVYYRNEDPLVYMPTADEKSNSALNSISILDFSISSTAETSATEREISARQASWINNAILAEVTERLGENAVLEYTYCMRRWKPKQAYLVGDYCVKEGVYDEFGELEVFIATRAHIAETQFTPEALTYFRKIGYLGDRKHYVRPSDVDFNDGYNSGNKVWWHDDEGDWTVMCSDMPDGSDTVDYQMPPNVFGWEFTDKWFRGIWTPVLDKIPEYVEPTPSTGTYSLNDDVYLDFNGSIDRYLSTTDNNLNFPASGVGWTKTHTWNGTEWVAV